MNYITSNITVHLDALNVADGTFPSHVYSVTFFVPMCSLLFNVMTANSRLPDWYVSFLIYSKIFAKKLITLTDSFTNGILIYLFFNFVFKVR